MALQTTIRQLFRSSYEVHVVQLVGVIGLLRITIALALDFLRPVLSPSEVMTDAAIFVIFAALCFLSFRLKVIRIPLVIGVVLIGLLGVNFLQFGGVTGYTEFNFIVGLVLLVMLYDGQTKVALVLLSIFVLLAMLAAVYFNHPVYTRMFIGEQTTPEDFVFSIIGLTLLTLYLKFAMDLERESLHVQNASVTTALRVTREKNRTLELQKISLAHSQKKLTEDVAQRTRQLEAQNAAIEQYLRYTTIELKEPLARLEEKLAQLDRPGMLMEMLRVSVEELKIVSKSVASTVENEHTLNTPANHQK
jgi:hypothetical protein